MKFNFTKGKNNSTALAIRMSISLVLALIIGITFILIRESLISNDKVEIWNTINSILFQDITTDEGRNSLGLFYILGQLFINCLQLIIIPMVFSSIALAMCHISDTKKLGRISYKTLLSFLTTSTFALATACIFGFIAYKLGFFNVHLSTNGATSVTTAAFALVLLLIAKHIVSISEATIIHFLALVIIKIILLFIPVFCLVSQIHFAYEQKLFLFCKHL